MPEGATPPANTGSGESRVVADVWPDFIARIPELLASQDPTTGRFGTQPFIVTDQNALWPLAVAWSAQPDDGLENPYFHSPEVLDAIIAGGDALIEVSDEAGMFEFRKKDNSTWGQIYMPWTYSRWIRAWALVRDAMPPDRRTAWDAALTKAVDGIVATALTMPVRNIPAHHAMGVYRASQVLDREDWRAAAVEYLHRTVDDQDPAGFWSEHFGPVVRYNFVYVDALGAYYGMSGDPYVLPALARAADFHANFTYPDGSGVETVDERNIYHLTPAAASIAVASVVGFTATPAGRGYLRWLSGLAPDQAPGTGRQADGLASVIAHGQEGPFEPPVAERDEHRFVLGDSDAMVQRREPWFVALSAYQCTPLPTNRWIQDRQAHLSVFHDQVGLVLSGSNTRLQPKWSTFTVGDTSLLAHRPGDEEPDFVAPPGLDHLPTSAVLKPDGLGIDLDYAGVPCSVRVELDGTGATVTYEVAGSADRPVAAHAGLVPHVGEAWRAGEHGGVLSAEPIQLTGAECGGSFTHHRWRVSVPPEAVLEWPVLPHNPYTKDGSAPLDEGRIVITVPLTAPGRADLVIEVG
ncbi:hypothetical protein [Microlunatus sp. Y2014]|uniref:hypothetical protein n=1 Tax=Microlunatus sp. Y2014 TaxID=3418488 RepID=UPI003DA798F9